jgi:hypothetical protein
MPAIAAEVAYQNQITPMNRWGRPRLHPPERERITPIVNGDVIMLLDLVEAR